jgi:hypothetical protein
MEKEAAIALWVSLEKKEISVTEQPAFNVRLDATADRDGRDYRIRVTAPGIGVGARWWREVLDAADEAGVSDVDIQNNGIELS